jgi:hypothetical protein
VVALGDGIGTGATSADDRAPHADRTKPIAPPRSSRDALLPVLVTDHRIGLLQALEDVASVEFDPRAGDHAGYVGLE